MVAPATPKDQYCPLCHKHMRILYLQRGVFYACFRPTCMVSINVNDPLIKIWNSLGLNKEDFPGGKLVAFFKRIE